jgi:transposase-like protein
MHQFPPAALFHSRHFNHAIIILCVRWYIAYKLSYMDLTEMMAERGVDVSHTTILRWVQCYVAEFEKRWRRYARPVGLSWRVDAHVHQSSQDDCQISIEQLISRV